jgi:cytochrome P450
VIGKLLDFLRDPLAFTAECVRLGPIVEVRLPGPPTYVVSGPALMEEVLVAQSRSFIKDKFTRDLSAVIGFGLLTSDGELWRSRRRIAQPAFSRGRIQAHAETMVAATEQRTADWRDGEARDAHDEMARVAIDIAARTLFGAEVGDDADRLSHALGVLMRRFADWRYDHLPLFTRLPIEANRRVRRAQEDLDGIIHRLIAGRRTDPGGRDDLLAMLLAARDEDGAPLSDAALRDEVMILFIAGHETSANALAWTWMLLAQHPAVEEKLLAEVDCVLGDRAPTADDVPKLPYTAQVLHESMRLYPPSWALGREAVEEVDLNGYRLPRGSQVIIPQWALQRDPRYFERPGSFEPERWSGDLARRLPKGVFIPFGAGPRACIGNSFAVMETVLVLATIARRFRLRLRDGFRPAPWPTITLRPRHGIPVVVRRRDAPGGAG